MKIRVDSDDKQLSWAVHVWDGPSAKGQDDWLVEWRDGRLRVAVIDGVTPWKSSCPDGFNAALWAAGVSRAALRSGLPIREALVRANAALYDPDVSPRRSAANACVIAADITTTDDGFRVTGVSAGDCELWALRHGQWTRCAGGPCVLPIWRQELADWRAAHPNATTDERARAEAEILEDVDRWKTTPPGRFETMRLEVSDVDAEALVLASDGAELTVDAFADLDEWVAGQVKAGRDDVTVLAIGDLWP